MLGNRVGMDLVKDSGLVMKLRGMIFDSATQPLRSGSVKFFRCGLFFSLSI
jgi:hypothetical protein